MYRLEMASVFCFVWLTAISNRFGVPIRNGVRPARDGGIDRLNAFEGVVFVSRLEMASVFCFVRVTAISNCFGVPIRNRFGIEYWAPQICGPVRVP